MYRRGSLIAVSFLLIVFTLYLQGCNPRSLVSTSQEVQIGQEASAEVEREYPLNHDPQLNALVNDLGQNLVQCSDRQNITYTFKILNVKEVNAFSLPGGWVYVNQGLIDATNGKTDELAGVIAHEIGHIAARHQAAMIGRQLEANILIGTLTSGQITQIAAIVADLQLLHYSRQEEYEADKLGIKEMWRCRSKDPQVYNPQGLIDFFGALLKIEGKAPSNFDQIFATHPVTANRISRAQQYLSDLETGRAKP